MIARPSSAAPAQRPSGGARSVLNTLDLSALAGAAIGAIAALPLVGGLPRGYDALIHLYRVAQLEWMTRDGAPFSRWAPDIALGYGVPLFNYYAPLLYYLALIPRLLGAELSQALVWVLVASTLLGAAGAALWMRDLFGPRAAAISAAAFACAPYFAFNLYQRGAYAEQLALCLAPLMFWVIGRATTAAHGGAADFGAADFGASRWRIALAVLFALLLLSHNISALVLTPLLFGYAALLHPRVNGRLPPAWPWMALGIGIAASFWLPALVERDLVQIARTYTSPAFDYRLNFLNASELFALPRAVQTGEIGFAVTRSVSLPITALAFAGLALGLRTAGVARRIAVAAAMLAIASAMMTLPLSQPLWDAAAPALRFVQFPWRFLGLFGLATVPLLALALARAHPLLQAAAITGMVAYAAPWQLPDFHPQPIARDVASLNAFERSWGLIGLGAGEYVPATVTEMPKEVARAERIRVPEGVLRSWRRGRESWHFDLDSATPFTATLDVFAFPGWQARIDDQPAQLLTEPGSGRIQVPMPAGTHRLSVNFASTPVRDAAAAASVVCAAILALAVARELRSAKRKRMDLRGELAAVNRSYAVTIGACVVLCLGGKLALDNAAHSPARVTRFNGKAIAGVQRPLTVNFDNKLLLLGMDIDAGATPSPTLTLYWHAPQPLDADYSTAVQLLDRSGGLVATSDVELPGGYATSLWHQPSARYYARDAHRLILAPATPPGEYTLQVAVYKRGEPGVRLRVTHAADGNDGEPQARLGSITLPRGRAGVESATPVQHVLNASFGPLRLIGADFAPEALLPGDAARVVLHWAADSPPQRDAAITLSIVNASGTVLSIREAVAPGFPSRQWRPGEVWRSTPTFRIPRAAVGGASDIVVSIDDAPPVKIAALRIDAPERLTRAPAPSHRQSAAFGDAGALIGFDLPNSAGRGDAFDVTLFWQPTRETDNKYTVFVQLVDAAGGRVGGHDGMPDSGSQPTSTWLPGTYVRDAHRIEVPADLPPGDYAVIVGMYDAFSLKRLPLADGSDHVKLDATVRIR